MASGIATHEAAHTAVARHLGLTVREVRVQDDVTIPVPRYCTELYGLPEGMHVPALGCMLEDDCLQRDTESVLIAMAAPSCIEIDPVLDRYAEMEATMALVYGSKHGLDPGWILDRAHQCVLQCRETILDIADRLDNEGVIDGSDL